MVGRIKNMQITLGRGRRISEKDFEEEIREINEELFQIKKEYNQKIMRINSNLSLTPEEKETELRLLQYDCTERYNSCKEALEEINAERARNQEDLIEDQEREKSEQIELLYKAYVDKINNDKGLTTEQKNKRIEIVESVLKDKKYENDMQNTEYGY